MNWYKEYKTEWKEIVETVARELGRSEQMVEKDTIQSMFLFELAKSEFPFVFKGGTSLSKVYNLIDRFSEDIDLSMNRRPTQSERVKSKELIIEIAENLGLVLSNPEDIKSRYDYNKYVFKYESLFSEIPSEIIVYKPVVEISKENKGALQFLDLMSTIDRYSEVSGDEFAVKIKDFISSVGVDFGQVKNYLSLFPDRVYRNIYQGGLMNELV